MIVNKAQPFVKPEEHKELANLFAQNEALFQEDKKDREITEKLKAEVASYHELNKALPEERYQEILSTLGRIAKTNEEGLAKSQENMDRIESIFAGAEERYYTSFAKAPDIRASIFADINEVARAITREDFESHRAAGYLKWSKKPNNSKNFREYATDLLHLQINALARYHLDNQEALNQIKTILLEVSRREYPRMTTRPEELSPILPEDTEPGRYLSMVDSRYNQFAELAYRNNSLESLYLLADRRTSRSHRGIKGQVVVKEKGIAYFANDTQGQFTGFIFPDAPGEELKLTPKKQILANSQIAEKITDLVLVELSKQPGMINNIADRGGTFTFNLQDFVDLGAYSSIKTARQALLSSRDAILKTSIIYDKLQRGKSLHSGVQGPLFQFDIDDKTKDVSVDINIRLAREIQNSRNSKEVFFISNFPEYYFRLHNPAMKLLKGILRHARTNRQQIETSKGSLSLTYKYVQELLSLPENPKDLTAKVIDPIENAIKEILQFERTYHRDAPEIHIATRVNKKETARKQIEQGRIIYTLSGETLNKILYLNRKIDSKEDAEQLEEAIE